MSEHAISGTDSSVGVTSLTPQEAKASLLAGISSPSETSGENFTQQEVEAQQLGAPSELTQQEALAATSAPLKLTTQEAKLSLLGGATKDKIVSVQQATLDKQNAFNGREQGPSLNGVPYVLLGNDAKKIAISEENDRTANAQRVAQANIQNTTDTTSIVSDEGLDTVGGAITNAGLTLFSGVLDAAGGIINITPTVVNYLKGINVNDGDLAVYASIKEKEAAGDTFRTPEEKELQTRGKGRPSSKFSSIEGIKGREEFKVFVNEILSMDKLVNNKKTAAGLKNLGNEADKAISKFEEGDYLGAVSTYVSGVAKLATVDTQAAVELGLNTLPQMYLLARHTLVGVSGLSATGYSEAIAEFKEEYGRSPNNQEKAIAGTLSIVSASLDAVGSKIVFKGKILPKSLKALADKMGWKVAKKTLDAAEGAVKLSAKDIGKSALGFTATVAKKAVTNAPVKSTLVEGATETTQSVLQQLAGKQDISKIDPSAALVEGGVGAVVGGGISTGVSSVDAVVKAPGKVQEGAKKVLDKIEPVLTAAGIGDATKIVKQAIKDNVPEKGIVALQENIDLIKLPKEERVAQLQTLATLIATHKVNAEDIKDDPTKREEELAKNAEYKRKFEVTIQAHNRLLAGGPKALDEAIEIITPKEVVEGAPENVISVEEVQGSLDNIIEFAQTTNDLTIEKTEKVLGSGPFDEGGTGTKAQKEILEAHLAQLKAAEVVENTNERIGKSKGTDEVSADVINGSPGFKGVNQYKADFHAATTRDEAVAVLTGLLEFLNKQTTKLDKGPIFFNKDGSDLPGRAVNGFLPNGKIQQYAPNGTKTTEGYIPHKGATLVNINNEIAAIKTAFTSLKLAGKSRFEVKSSEVVETSTEQGPGPSTETVSEPDIEATTTTVKEAKVTPAPEEKVAPEPVQTAQSEEVSEPVTDENIVDLESIDYDSVVIRLEKKNITEKVVINNKEVVLDRPLDEELRSVDDTLNGLVATLTDVLSLIKRKDKGEKLPCAI